MNLHRIVAAATFAVFLIIVGPMAALGAETVSAPTIASTTSSSTTSTSTTSTSTTSTTIVATSTIAPLGFSPICGEPLMRLALEVGWEMSDLPRLDAVAFRESGADCGNVDTNMSWNRADPYSGSRGTLQVNGFWCSWTKYNDHPAGWLGERGILDSCDDLFDVRTNLIAGLAIFHHSGGWGPWGG